jgi:cytochrome oxidase assembly protein ShyY1
MTMSQTLRLLRQPRYAALSALMLLVAIVCVSAGTWQIARLATKADANHELRTNAHAGAVAVAELLPLVGDPAGRPASHRIEFRQLTATGTYDGANQSLVRNRDVNGDTGWFVLTPLRTADGALLVARGFISESSTRAGAAPAIPAAPIGTVTITARAHPADTGTDKAAQLTGGQVEAINPAEQQSRFGAPMFDGYGALESGQPGSAGLAAIPGPDLSNPAGGAVEPQHLAYIVQWYLFAALALAAPVVMARSENRDHVAGDFDAAPDEQAAEPSPDTTAEQLRAAKLADRYGRAAR